VEFRIADTFTDALARLPAQEQKVVKTSAFDLQLDPASPGLKLHRIDRSKDANFWSIRVNRDIRIIVHKTAASFLLAYVDHHDKAYAWAERRRIEAHPKTGAVQIVEMRERVEEITPAPAYGLAPTLSVEPPATDAVSVEPASVQPVVPLEPSPPIFADLTSDDLLEVGVPTDWVEDVLAADEDHFLQMASHLPAEAAEALLEYAATGQLKRPVAVPAEEAYSHPDTLRRFRVVENVEALEQALEAPWERWTVFLHPSQRNVVERSFDGPARVAGSAGTGKTIVAIHRAARLARISPERRVLLTTFSRPLANALRRKLTTLVGPNSDVVPRIRVAPLAELADELRQLIDGRRPHIASKAIIRSALERAAEAEGVKEFTTRFLMSEWTHVVDAWQLDRAEAYAEVPRLGRRNRLGAKQRERLWPVFVATKQALAEKGLSTRAEVLADLAGHYAARSEKPFDHIVVDEAQDVGVAELRFLAAIAPDGMDSLFFAGDLGQRIFQQPFSWLKLGVDIRGRSQVLKVNYRTSHQIRRAADRLLPKAIRDVDGDEDRREGTVSVFNGPEPVVDLHGDAEAEGRALADWLRQASSDGIEPAEIGIFVRTPELLDRARAAVRGAGFTPFELSERAVDPGDRISIGTMHLAKGLEFKAVAVMACDDEVLPLQERVEAVADEAELDDVYETERHLLYVAATRARERLLIAGVTPGSEYLLDLAN